MIRRIACVSRPRPNLSSVEIPRIVNVSRLNNARHAITGVLVFTGSDFAQLLEGAPDNVETLWQRLCRDERHLDLTSLLDERDTSRWFLDWRMGYLSDSAHASRLAAWRRLARPLGREERIELRFLLAAADAM